MVSGYKSGKVAIVGWHEGTAGQLHALLEEEGITITCFINNEDKPVMLVNPPPRPTRFSYPTSSSYKEIPLITTKKWVEYLLDQDITNVLVACSDNTQRQRFLSEAQGKLTILGYIHPTAVILPEAIIEEAAIILPRVVIGYRAAIYSGAFISTGAQIDHNSVVRSCASLLPGAIICGSVDIGERTTVGAGATIINSKKLGADSFVGAGALVLHDVMPNICVVGVPAYPLKYIKSP